MLTFDMYFRDGSCITVKNPNGNYDNKMLLEKARAIYDSFPEDVWQSQRP